MGKPYAEEMAGLARTLSWAEAAGVEKLAEALCGSYGRPLLAVGSGGSLTTCHFMAMLHRRLARQAARVCTPLEFLQEAACEGESAWFISAGGANTDILKAFEASVRTEPRAMGVLCADASSPLARAAEECTYCDLALFDLPGGKDGFLATNSLVAFCVLLTRAYETLFRGEARSFEGFARLRGLVEAGASAVDGDFAKIERVLARQTLVVLHGAATRPAASSLSSGPTKATTPDCSACFASQ